MSDTIATPVAESAPLTSANIARMDQDTWARTFMPSLVTPATEPAPETPTDAPADPVRGADGKFLAKPGTNAPIGDTNGADAGTIPPVSDTKAPDAETPPVVLPFVATGADGTAVDPATLAGMQITLKANGVETQMALSDLVRQAQSAAGASRQANELRANITARDSELASMRADATALEQALVQALTDDDARAHLADRYRAYTAPEAELSRLKSQQAADAASQREMAQQQQAQSATVDFTHKLTGMFEAMTAKFPDVTPQELLGQFNFDTAGLAVSGVIPPERFGEVEAYVASSLTAYAQQRQSAIGTLRTRAESAAKAAEAQALAAKNQMAAAVRPSGAPALPGGAPSKPQITTLKDATAYALGAFAPS